MVNEDVFLLHIFMDSSETAVYGWRMRCLMKSGSTHEVSTKVRLELVQRWSQKTKTLAILNCHLKTEKSESECGKQ